MTTSYRDTSPASTRVARGTGSLRERRPGVREIRVVVGFDPVRRRSVQRSFSVRGSRKFAEWRRDELVAEFGEDRRAGFVDGARVTVSGLLERWVAAGEGRLKPTALASVGGMTC